MSQLLGGLEWLPSQYCNGCPAQAKFLCPPYLPAVIGDEFKEKSDDELHHWRTFAVSVCKKLPTVHKSTDVLHQL